VAYVLAPDKTAEQSAGEKIQAASDQQPQPPSVPGRSGHSPELLARVLGRIHALTRLFRRPLPPKELILFASQLSIMAETGTSLVESLEALDEQATNTRLQKALSSIRAEVKSGQTFSAAMGRHNDVFPDIMVSLISIGESGGFLEQMLNRMSNILAKQAELRSTVRSAFTYPMVLAGFCVLVVGFMMAFILPKFVNIFADMEASLPAPTRLLLGTVDLMAARWMIIVPSALALGIGMFVFFSLPSGRRLSDRWILSLPAVGPFIRNVIVSRLMRSVGELLHTGVPLLDALRVSKPLLGNTLYSDMIGRVETSITAGKTL